MNKKNNFWMIISIFCATIFSSCITKIDMNNPDDIQLNTSLALPIGSVHANIGQFIGAIDSSLISANEDKTIYLTLEEDFGQLDFIQFNVSAQDKVTEALTLATKSPFKEIFEKLPISEYTVPEDMTFDFYIDSHYNIDFSSALGGESIIRIDTITLKNAFIDLDVEVEGIKFSDGMYLELDFNYPDFLVDSTLFKNVRIDKNKTIFREDMNHVKAYLCNIPESGRADLRLNFRLVCKKGAVITRDMKLKFTSEISLDGLDGLYGFIWKEDPLVDTEVAMDMPTDIFENPLLAENTLLFSNPQVELNLKSNVGLPLECTINHIYATDANGNKEYADFKGSQSYSIILNTPEKMGDTAETSIRLDRENGGTNKLFKTIPKTINYGWKISTPYKNSTENYFVPNMDSIEIDANMKAVIPMQFDAGTSFQYSDTLDADMTSLAEAINIVTIDTLNLHLDILNSIPAELGVRLHYLDINGDILSSTNEYIIPSASVDEEGKVTEATKFTKKVVSTNDNIEDICNTKQIIIEASLKNLENRIYFQTDNRIDINLSAFFKGDVNLPQETNK